MKKYLLKLPKKYGLGQHLFAEGGVCEMHIKAGFQRGQGKLKTSSNRVQKWRRRPTPGSWTSYAKGLGINHPVCKKSRDRWLQQLNTSAAGAWEWWRHWWDQGSYSQGFLCSVSSVENIGRQWENTSDVGHIYLAWLEPGANWSSRSRSGFIHPLKQQNIFLMWGAFFGHRIVLPPTCDLY